VGPTVGSCFAHVFTLVSTIGGVVALRAGPQRLLQSRGKGFIGKGHSWSCGGDRLDWVCRRTWGQFRIHAGRHVVNLALFWHSLRCVVNIIDIVDIVVHAAEVVRGV